MIESLIGYDVREEDLAPYDLWPPERRATFLIKPDAEAPLSVDTLVWPSIFETGQGSDWHNDWRKRAGLGDAVVPEWLGPNDGLWEDYRLMLKYLAMQLGIASRKMLVVAITLAESIHVPSDEPPYTLGVFSGAGDWQNLGYDIADSFLISGLSNCSYSTEESNSAKLKGAERLNSNHLFVRPEDADEYRIYTDTRVPEHAPFHVYGIWGKHAVLS
jgi:hypothetical protein